MKYLLVYRKNVYAVKKTTVTTCIYAHAITAVYNSNQNMGYDVIQLITNLVLLSILFL